MILLVASVESIQDKLTPVALMLVVLLMLTGGVLRASPLGEKMGKKIVVSGFVSILVILGVGTADGWAVTKGVGASIWSGTGALIQLVFDSLK